LISKNFLNVCFGYNIKYNNLPKSNKQDSKLALKEILQQEKELRSVRGRVI
jgi:hypothetical protein